MGNAIDKRCRENQNTPYMFNNFFFPENQDFYKLMSNHVKSERPKIKTIWRIQVASWISKTTRAHEHAYVQAPEQPPTLTHPLARTHIHTGRCVIPTAFPWQLWFANALQCYLICTLPVLFLLSVSRLNGTESNNCICPLLGWDWGLRSLPV